MKYLAAVLLSVLVCSTAHALVITQNTDPTTILADNSAACASGSETRDNSYFRSFSFASLGITEDFSISSIQFGVQSVVGSGSSPLTVSVYSGTSLSTLGTVLGTASTSVTAANNLSLVTLNLDALVLAGAEGFVVGIYSPEVAGQSFYLGSNSAGQSAPSYILAPDCGITTPTELASVGFADMQIVMSVEGTTAVPEPTAGTLVVSGGLLGLIGGIRRRRTGSGLAA